ncbi:30S ribosome-binding factor RbfA [Candidatus Berkiella aquae]|uniref:Ribosome-binding factor A n=1 Tax=Candidatus Berkiella aquae TaxID=295108 RepID=A0A0Q9YM04_9GAMM|nr:30S ribosome-binding factor RbfA [Candidatus Berkiella aquae]MCS5710551.1 30S ribosome-binding factor RbfA [Candidatus Berkiella aquae]
MARDFSRTDRIADVMQRELSVLIREELKDPRVGMITISEIKVSKDLAYAKVFVSVMMEEKAKETLEGLNKAAGFLRGQLARKMTIRVMPQLSFVYDDTTIKANRISRLIDDAIASDKKDNES